MKKRKADGTLKLNSRGRRRGVDRLSALPGDVVGHILDFLPTPQAVLTSLLSRRWRRVWSEHARALDLSVHDLAYMSDYADLSREAVQRFPSTGIPSLSLEFDGRVYIAGKDNAWYGEAMARAVGSVRVRVPRGINVLDLPLCTRAEALTLTLNHWLILRYPASPVLYGRLTELSLSSVKLQYAYVMPPPFHEFLSSCCPRLRRLRLSCVRGDALRRLVICSEFLEDLDLNNVEALTTVDVVAANLRSLSVRSCFRFPYIREETMVEEEEEDSEVVVTAARTEAICWYRSYPKRLVFPGGLNHVRRLSGLKLPTLGRRDQFDFPYTLQLLQACSLTAQHLDLDLIVPDQTALLNWLGPAHPRPEDLMGYVPQLPRVSVLSLTLRWGLGVSVAPSLASLLSRLPTLSSLHLHSSPYCQTVLERQETSRDQRRGDEFQYVIGKEDEQLMINLGSLREISVDGLTAADSEECRVVELLFGAAAAAPPSSPLERISLMFRDTAAAAAAANSIAGQAGACFPMATGRWAAATAHARGCLLSGQKARSTYSFAL